MNVRIADLTVALECRYPYTGELCRDYVVTDGEPDFAVSVGEDEVRRRVDETGGALSEGYCEGTLLYQKICEGLYPYQAFLFHAAVVAVDGEAYAFSAKSGTGKSTHASLWLEEFAGRAEIINGDKPIVRLKEDGRVYVSGTPWCGKERWQVNKSAPLRAIAFLERDGENRIGRMEVREAIRRTFQQILIPKGAGDMDALLGVLDKVLQRTPCYLLRCNREREAARLAYEGMGGA